jgi:serine/threonine protein kinase
MKAEALIGGTLGTCTLQRLIGQGGMGAVYLAQQSRPKRLVAVKVLLPMTPLTSYQLAAFLERFRRETDTAAAMDHPNIIPVHEYGEQGGLAYLVMPYISSGTLRDELERSGPLPLDKVANYLEQLGAAVDYAHERKVVHRDIKPANIMITPEGRLLLGDFGLVKIVSDGQAPQVRLTGEGAPVGTPDYMSPEQVIGENVDARADLYSLGVILYQMVTGTTPFHGETPMQIAAQHLQVPPPSAQIMRPDLPQAVEGVIQRALSKRPDDRYASGRALARAFRMALLDSGMELDADYAAEESLGVTTTGHMVASRRPADVLSQDQLASQNLPSPDDHPVTNQAAQAASEALESLSMTSSRLWAHTGKLPANHTGACASLPIKTSPSSAQGGTGLLSRTGKFPMVGTGVVPAALSAPTRVQGGGLLSRTGKFATLRNETDIDRCLPVADSEEESHGTQSEDDSLVEAVEPVSSIKLTSPMKVVKVSVLGQPGKYVTGLLPMVPAVPVTNPPAKRKLSLGKKLLLIIAVIVLVVAGLAGGLLFLRGHTPLPNSTPSKGPNGSSSLQTSISTPSTRANSTDKVLFSDPLTSNTYNWTTSPANAFAFKDGTYHITCQDSEFGNATVLQDRPFGANITYTLTLEEIAGDDTNTRNSFGMIFRFSKQNKVNSRNQPIVTFYSFEVVNIKGGEYKFWKYDNTNPDDPWKEIKDGRLNFGSEFHQGQGAQARNTISIAMHSDKFVVTVNGTKLDRTFQDNTLTAGAVGMLVNLKGTEVAFKDLVISQN